jgi:hypothetical protein
MNLIDLKVKYSNTDTKTEFCPWFYENFDKEGYSIWKVDFKYNEVRSSLCFLRFTSSRAQADLLYLRLFFRLP